MGGSGRRETPMERRIGLGSVLQPWPGEALLGRVTAFSVCGEYLVCETHNGERFEVAVRDVEAGAVPLVVRVDHEAEPPPESQRVPSLTSERTPVYSVRSRHDDAEDSKRSGIPWASVVGFA